MKPGSKLAKLAMAAPVVMCLVATSVAAEEPEAGPNSQPEPADKAISAIDAFITAQKVDKQKSVWKSHLTKPPKVEFSSGSSYFWNLDTNKGSIKVKLYADSAPMHVSSTIYLTRLGFYDNVVFHRVIAGFMAQGGDPTGTGRGGPGYKYAGEFDGGRTHSKPGILSMANAGPNTDGSQFFLTFVATSFLNGKHTVFGEVVDGMETVKQLEKAGSRRGTPKEKLYIEKATISIEKSRADEESATGARPDASSRATPARSRWPENGGPV